MNRKILFIIAFATALLCQLFLWPAMDGVYGGTIPGSKPLYLPVVRTTCFAGNVYVCDVANFSLRSTDIQSVTEAVSHTGFDTYINPSTGARTQVQFITAIYKSSDGSVYTTDSYTVANSPEEAHAFFLEGDFGKKFVVDGLLDEYSTSIITSTDVVTMGIWFRTANTLTSIVVAQRETKAVCGLACLAHTVYWRIR